MGENPKKKTKANPRKLDLDGRFVNQCERFFGRRTRTNSSLTLSRREGNSPPWVGKQTQADALRYANSANSAVPLSRKFVIHPLQIDMGRVNDLQWSE